MAVQLYVYDDLGARYEVELYQEEPIKITLSAENLGDLPTVDSAFSRQFRIPANQHNSKVFKWWYEVNTIDFDVTKKIKSEIHVDGILYKTGHVRIQAAYVNEVSDNIDLELVFFGEVRDFSTQLGEGLLTGLPLGHLAHKLTTDNIQKSWLPLTDVNVLVDGGIRYIIADRGYEYEEANNELVPTLNEIACDDVGQYNRGFTRSNHPITLGQFTPMIQVKQIIDAIFDQTDYSYSSDSVFTEDWFKDLYTDGLPEGLPETPSTNADFEVGPAGNIFFNPSATIIPALTIEYEDNANAYNTATRKYTAVETDTLTFEVDFDYGLQRYVNAPNPTVVTKLMKNGTTVATDTFTAPVGVTPYLYTASISQAVSVVPGDEIFVTIQVNKGSAHNLFGTSRFFMNGSSLTISANNLVKKEVKQVDFLKSILTKFKLIMTPSVDNEFEFVIKPYKDYIGSGDRLDWTYKLDGSKDTVLQPVFYDQSQRLIFTDQEDVDKMNDQHQTELDRVYGTLFFDSQNELLSEERNITTIFAPTPVNQIEGALPNSNFIIPFFTKHTPGVAYHGHAPHEPMTPKPRLLFWNGMIDVTASEEWYYEGPNDAGTTVKIQEDQYPRMSYLTEIPSLNTTLNLNWFREFAYFEITGGPDGQLGESVYERFWNSYVQSLYSPLARKLTAYFTIDAQDLRKLSFDDLIYIKNAWYRPLKIYNAPLTDIATVKVDLVKILDSEIFENNSTPTENGGGIDFSDPTGGGGSPVGGGTSRVYTIQTCINPGDPQYASYTSVNPLTAGQSVKTSADGGAECWEIINVTTNTATATVLSVYTDCTECQSE